MGRKGKQCGFTLVEVLVVIAIIGVLVALIFPAVQSARESARRTRCRNSLNQIGIALQNYHESHTTFPPGWIGVTSGLPDVNGVSGFGWASMILPALEQGSLYDQLLFGKPLTNTTNAAAHESSLSVYRCPSDIGSDRWEIRLAAGQSNPDLPLELPTANYVGSFGSTDVGACESNLSGEACLGDGLFFLNSRVRAEHIFDGTSNTFLVGERKSDANQIDAPFTTWVGVARGGERNISRILGGPFEHFSSHHDGGAHMLFADGHVQLISGTIDRQLFANLSTRAGRETVGEF